MTNTKAKRTIAVPLNVEQAELILNILNGAGSEWLFPGTDALREHLKTQLSIIDGQMPNLRKK